MIPVRLDHGVQGKFRLFKIYNSMSDTSYETGAWARIAFVYRAVLTPGLAWLFGNINGCCKLPIATRFGDRILIIKAV